MKLNPDLVDRAIAIAVEVHAGQRDRGGAPYILHPLRLMSKMDTDHERMAAVLHDVVEDGDDWTFARLMKEEFPSCVIDAVKALTRVEGESYTAYIQRCKDDVLASKVKAADLRDNMDMSRLRVITVKDVDRFEKYRAALCVLASEHIEELGL